MNHGNDVKCSKIYLQWNRWKFCDNSVNWRYSQTPTLRGHPLLCAHLPKSRKTFPIITVKPMVRTSYFLLSLPILNGLFVNMWHNYNVTFTIQSTFRRIYMESSEHNVAPTGWSFGKGAFFILFFLNMPTNCIISQI